MKQPSCHPEEILYRQGLCRTCYRRQVIGTPAKKPARIPDCHPDRKHRGKGMCASCYYTHRRESDIDKARAYGRERARKERRENPEKVREREKQYRRDNREHMKDVGFFTRILRDFGMLRTDYLAMWNQQGGRCALCNIPLEFRGRQTCLDHNHETGFVRGILCNWCNVRIGFIERRGLSGIEKDLAYIKPGEHCPSCRCGMVK